MIELKLDTNALSSLIEKDPQFKLSIQQAVLQNIANRYVKLAGDTISSEISKAADAAKDEILSQHLDVVSQYPLRYKLKPVAKTRIKEQYQNEINNMLGSLVFDATERAEKVMKDAFESCTKEKLTQMIDSILDKYINAYIKAKVEERFKEAMAHINT